MVNNIGTPQNLEQAIEHLVNSPLSKSKDIMQDYLAQKFGIAMLKAKDSPETQKILNELWEAIKK